MNHFSNFDTILQGDPYPFYKSLITNYGANSLTTLWGFTLPTFQCDYYDGSKYPLTTAFGQAILANLIGQGVQEILPKETKWLVPVVFGGALLYNIKRQLYPPVEIFSYEIDEIDNDYGNELSPIIEKKKSIHLEKRSETNLTSSSEEEEEGESSQSGQLVIDYEGQVRLN